MPQITNLRFYTPASPLVELLSGNRFKLARDCSVIRQYAADIVKLKRQQQHTAAATGTGPTPKADGDECVAKDLLSLFMEAVGPGGKPLSDRQLVDTVINFIIAGRDTTAQVTCTQQQAVNVCAASQIGRASVYKPSQCILQRGGACFCRAALLELYAPQATPCPESKPTVHT